IAVAPDVRIFFEVSPPVLAAVRVVPEPERHRRERLGAHELTFLSAHGFPFIVVYLDLHAETPALNLAAPHREERIAEHEAGNQIGAPGDGGETDVALHAAIDVVESFRRERAAGGEEN